MGNSEYADKTLTSPSVHGCILTAFQVQVTDCQVKLQRADKLIGGLGGERTRWAATVQQLQSDLHNVVGDVVLAAGERSGGASAGCAARCTACGTSPSTRVP
jgi:hypothetical protein